MKNLLFILIVTLIFSSCQKDNDSYYRWQITDLNYNWELTDISVVNDDTIYVLSYLDSTYQNSVLFQSNDAGKKWTKNSFPKIDEGGFRSIFCLNSSIVFTGGVDGIYQSNDGGINWQKIGLNGQQVKGGVIYFFDKKNGIIANTNTIFKTTDGGNSFIEVYDTAAIMSFTQIQFLNEQVGYAVGGASYDSYNFGIMVKTTDGGNTWNPVPKPFKSIIGMSFVSPDIGYVVVSLFESDIAGISATSYIQVASLAGVIIGGIIADRWSRTHIKGRLYVPIIGFTLGAPFLFIMASTGVFGIAIAGMLVFGLARGFHDSNLMPIMCQVVDSRYRATGYGIMNFFSTIIGGIMVYVGGALKDANVNLSLVFQISAVGLLISSWLLFAVKPKSEA